MLVNALRATSRRVLLKEIDKTSMANGRLANGSLPRQPRYLRSRSPSRVEYPVTLCIIVDRISPVSYEMKNAVAPREIYDTPRASRKSLEYFLSLNGMNI